MNSLVHLTSESAVRGINVYARGCKNPVLAFLGIPFAEPPVGKLRFAPPVPLTLWKGEKNANKYGSFCPQDLDAIRKFYFPFHIPDDMSEDCLYLNIWTPPTADINSKLPVMVWFYGGAYVQGLSNFYDGTAYAVLHNVVFVSINYRLGPFGFLCTGDAGIVNGNMGLFDQLEALRWIQKHIEKFGGDPDNVTVFGESAGAISISIHIVSPLSRGLFKRAILESGSSCFHAAAWQKKSAGKYVINKIRQWGGTDVQTETDIINFLNKKSSKEIIANLGIGFNPVIDGTLLTEAPNILYRSGRFNEVDVLMGFNTHEGAYFIDLLTGAAATINKEEALKILEIVICRSLYRGTENVDRIFHEAQKHYLKDIHDTLELKKQLVDMYGDFLFVLPTVDQANLHSVKAKTYLYQFDHRPFFSKYPDWVIADHGHEVTYVIGEPHLNRLNIDWTNEEKKMSSMIMTYWSNFAKTGDPNGKGLMYWPPYDSTNQQFAILKNHSQVKSCYQPEKMKFWMNTIHRLASRQQALIMKCHPYLCTQMISYELVIL